MEIEKLVIKEVATLVTPILKEMGMELVDVQFRHENMGWVLRIFIDKPDGITVEDCANVSREISHHLDVKDIIPHRYHLEVSSPGVNRVLKKIEDFKRFTGRRAHITTEAPVGMRRNFTGIIKGVNGDRVIIDVDGNNYEISLGLICRANLKEI